MSKTNLSHGYSGRLELTPDFIYHTDHSIYLCLSHTLLPI